jgi:TonB-linked SusC/RagA family outer membrane protein
LDVALQNSGVVNPLIQVENEWDKTISIEYRTVGSVYADINFLRYLNFRATLYGDVSNLDNRQYTPLYYAYNPLDNTAAAPYLVNQTTQVSQDNNSWKKWQQDYILTFRKKFGDHNLTVTGGFTTYYFGNFNRHGTAKQYTTGTALPIPDDPRFWYMTSGFEDPSNTFATSSQNEYSTVSYLARALYNYKGKYYLNASFRDDGSSQIPTNNRYQQFWAVGAAWELTKENFMKDQKIFDFIKLKGSIGVLGNQTASYLDGTPINYPFYPQLNTGISAVFGTNIYSAAQPSYQPNPDLKWETVNAKEIGVELNAFHNRLHFEANYFDKKTDNLMTYVSRAELGLPDELINGGSIKNWGEEFTASWNQTISKDFTVTIGGNITFLKNKVLSLNKDLPTGVLIRGFQNNGSAESRTLPGYPIGSFYGYVVEGLYQSYADILKSPVASSIGSYRPGDFKFKDVNGDGKITSDDRTVIGNPTPDFTYGLSLGADYKGLSLSIDMVGVYGNEIFRTWGSLESPFQRVNYAAFQVDAWHGSGTSNWVPIISQADRFNYNGSTYNIEDGSYFRIRNVQLGYSLPQSLISKWHMKNLRIYANGQNLKTWKNNYGYTAEFGGDATAFGYDNAGGALPMVVTFGLNVTF